MTQEVRIGMNRHEELPCRKMTEVDTTSVCAVPGWLQLLLGTICLRHDAVPMHFAKSKFTLQSKIEHRAFPRKDYRNHMKSYYEIIRPDVALGLPTASHTPLAPIHTNSLHVYFVPSTSNYDFVGKLSCRTYSCTLHRLRRPAKR